MIQNLSHKRISILTVLILFFFGSDAISQSKTQETIKHIIDQHNEVLMDDAITSSISKGLFKDRADVYSKTKTYYYDAIASSADTECFKAGLFLSLHHVQLVQVDSSQYYLDQIKKLESESTNNILKGRYYYLSGSNAVDYGGEEKQIQFLDRAIDYFQVQMDSSVTAWAMSYYIKALIAEKKEYFIEALNNYTAAYTLLHKVHDSNNLLLTLSSLVDLYSRNYLFEEAYVKREEVITLAKELEEFDVLAIQYLNFAVNEKTQNSHENQLIYLDKAKQFSDLSERGYVKFSTAYSRLVYFAQNNSLASAELEFDLLNGSYSSLKNYEWFRILYKDAEAHLAYVKQDFAYAEILAQEKLNLSEKMEEKELILEAHELLFAIYEKTNRSNLAIKHKNAILLQQNETKQLALKNQLAYFQTNFDTERKDYKIQIQEIDIALLNTKHRVKNQWILFGTLSFIGIFITYYFYRSKQFAKQKQFQQEKFTHNLINAQEQERTRVARELHDSVGQQLVLLTRKTKSSGDATMEELATNTLAELRAISQGLHPAILERLGFTTAVENMIDDLDQQVEMYVSSDLENVDANIDKQTALHLYRIIQEILSNILKHTQAKAASVAITKKPEHINLSIKDNGKGFDFANKLKTSKSLGLRSILERCKIINAALHVNSTPSKGSEFSIKLPIT